MADTGICFHGIVSNAEYHSVGSIYADSPSPCEVAIERF